MMVFVVLQKLNHEVEETKDQPWGEHSSDESSTEEEDEVRTKWITLNVNIKIITDNYLILFN